MFMGVIWFLLNTTAVNGANTAKFSFNIDFLNVSLKFGACEKHMGSLKVICLSSTNILWPMLK